MTRGGSDVRQQPWLRFFERLPIFYVSIKDCYLICILLMTDCTPGTFSTTFVTCSR